MTSSASNAQVRSDKQPPATRGGSTETSVQSRISEFLPAAHHFVATHPEEWRLEGNIELEVTNHVLRVHIQDGTLSQYRGDVLELCRGQHADGGWGEHRDDEVSHLRSTAFCTQMLLRANRQLREARVSEAIERAMGLILANQLPDGSWRDPRWHLLDATSVSVGTLLFAVHEPAATEAQRQALRLGMDFILSQRRADGLWYYKPRASPVTISAHLLQKCATYRAGDPLVANSAHALARLQSREGHWDEQNTDHTCDAIRCLMLCASILKEPELRSRVHEAAQRAVSWLMECAVDGGLGDRPGRTPHVERTCDMIDTLLKYRTFQAQLETLVSYWR